MLSSIRTDNCACLQYPEKTAPRYTHTRMHRTRVHSQWSPVHTNPFTPHSCFLRSACVSVCVLCFACSFKIREIDLAAEDFSLPQLIRGNERLRMQCYYEVETATEAINRKRRAKRERDKDDDPKQAKEAKQAREKLKKAREKLRSSTKNGKGGEELVEGIGLTPEEKEQLRKIRDKERDKLFLCFKKFFEDNQLRMFSLQNIDRMLVQETASCEDRLVNKDCVRQHVYLGKSTSVSLSPDGGTSLGKLSNSAGAAKGAAGVKDQVCCLPKGATEPLLSKECNGKEGNREVSLEKCAKRPSAVQSKLSRACTYCSSELKPPSSSLAPCLSSSFWSISRIPWDRDS